MLHERNDGEEDGSLHVDNRVTMTNMMHPFTNFYLSCAKKKKSQDTEYEVMHILALLHASCT